MFELVGDSKSHYPQRIKETICDDINQYILDKPLELAIEHLKIYLNNSQHEKLRLERGYSYGSNKAPISLVGIRSETDEEVETRLNTKKGYILRDIDSTQNKITNLKNEIEKLEMEALKKQELLAEFNNPKNIETSR